MNGKKQSQNSTSGRKGTGIENVKRRLELLYKDRHELKINEDEEVFVVNLAIELSKNVITPPVSTTVLTEQYA